MTMQQINTLQWEDLKRYYDDSINAITSMSEAKSELRQLKDKLENKKTSLGYTTVFFWAVFFGFLVASILVIIAAIVMACINSLLPEMELFDKFGTDCGIICLVALAILWLICGFIIGNSSQTNQVVNEKRKKYSNDISLLDKEIVKTQQKITNIENGSMYQDMLCVFEDNQDLNYIKELRKIVLSQRATTHPEAVKFYDAQKLIEEQKKLSEEAIDAENRKAYALQNVAKSNEHIASSTAELSKSLDRLTVKVNTLNTKCNKGGATEDDVTSVVGATADCLSLVDSVVHLVEILPK